MPATKGESELLQNYFDDRRPGYLVGIVEDALSAHARKKREERNARQAAEPRNSLRICRNRQRISENRF